MTDIVERAIGVLNALPPGTREEAAGLLLRVYADEEGEIYKLTPEEHAAQDEADEAIARGDFATDEEMRALFDEYKL